jgi:putative aldouronate transport system permease protein
MQIICTKQHVSPAVSIDIYNNECYIGEKMTEKFPAPSTAREGLPSTVPLPLPRPIQMLPPLRKRTQRDSLTQRIWRKRGIYLCLLPGVVYFLVFYYVPLLGNVVAFEDYSPYLGFFRSPWVGWENFQAVFSDPDTLIVVRNTLEISLFQVLFAFPAGIVLALMLNAVISQRFKRFMQSILYLPHFLGWVILISIWQQLFGGDGFLSQLVVGLGGKPVDLITNPAFSSQWCCFR